MRNKGKVRVTCTHPGCTKVGYLTVEAKSCLDDDGIAWMCARHDDMRTMRENAALVRIEGI